MKIYAGNLAANTTNAHLQNAFSAHGEVSSARLIADKETGKLRGFAIVDMGDETEAQAAITALHGTELNGNKLKVVEAKRKGESGTGKTAPITIVPADAETE